MQSSIGDPIQGLRWETLLRGLVFIFVAIRSSAPQAAAHPETDCCLLADKSDVSCKSDVLDCICRKAVPPWAACLPRPCSTGTIESLSSCNMYLSRVAEVPNLHCPSAFLWWLCHRQRDGKIVSFLYETVFEIVQSLKGILFPEGQESTEPSARQEKPCLSCR